MICMNAYTDAESRIKSNAYTSMCICKHMQADTLCFEDEMDMSESGKRICATLNKEDKF